MEKEKSIPPPQKYSQAFKIQVVREYERGFESKDTLMNKYQIRGHSTVLQWCRQYGKLYYPKRKVLGRPMKDPQKQRIKELEHELKEAQEKLMVYEKLIEIAKRESGIDIIKNTDTKLPSNWQPKEKL